MTKVWEELLAKADEIDCEEPVLPRRRALKHTDEATHTLMQHQRTCIIRTILKSLTHLLVKVSTDLSHLLPSTPRWKVFLENAAIGKNISTKDVKVKVHFK